VGHCKSHKRNNDMDPVCGSEPPRSSPCALMLPRKVAVHFETQSQCRAGAAKGTGFFAVASNYQAPRPHPAPGPTCPSPIPHLHLPSPPPPPTTPLTTHTHTHFTPTHHHHHPRPRLAPALCPHRPRPAARPRPPAGPTPHAPYTYTPPRAPCPVPVVGSPNGTDLGPPNRTPCTGNPPSRCLYQTPAAVGGRDEHP
jgi:hypothetical protein